jgi:hypothetical protein
MENKQPHGSTGWINRSIAGTFISEQELNPVWAIVTVIVASGLLATARLILEKNKLWHLEAGYALGFTILYLVIYFV